MKKTRYFILLLLICEQFSTFAGTLRGKVSDDQGKPLAFAAIFVEGTTLGTNANGLGVYELELAPGLYKVTCQYVGYKQVFFNVEITGDKQIEHNFTLASQSLEMKELVVHANGEDPAYRIIRQAIKKRKSHDEQIKSFQTSIYMKGVMKSRHTPKKVMGKKIDTEDLGAADTTGRGILMLTEEDADYYTDGKKGRTVIHSVHESGDPNGVGFAKLPPVVSFYENNVNVFGKTDRGYISPIGENALFYYTYKLQGQFTEGGHTIYKIDIKPKRAYEPCFSGTVYIVDTDFAFHSLDLTLTKENGMDMLDTIMLKQLYLPLKEDTWVIKSQVMYLAIKIFGFDIVGSGVTVYNNQKVNVAMPDSLFQDRITSSYDKKANKKDTTYWTTARPIPLEKDEKRDYVVKDSLRLVAENPARRDSLRKKGNKFNFGSLLISGASFSGKEYKKRFSTNSVLLGIAGDNMVNFNIVEGFNLAPKLSYWQMLDTGKFLRVDGAMRYGFTNTHFNAIGRIFYFENDRTFTGKGWLTGVEGGKYVFQYNSENPVLPWFNTYSDLFYRENDLKIYERWEGSGFFRQSYGNGLVWMAKFSYEQRLPLQNSTTYSFIKGTNEGYTNNIPTHLAETATAWEKHDAALLYMSISYKPGFTYIQYPDRKVPQGSNWPRFTLTYDKGIHGLLGSKVDFDKWRFNIKDDLKLKLFGNISYNVAVGGFLNTNYVSIPDLMHLYGNRGIGYASAYLSSFQFAQYYEFSNKEKLYGEGHVEYHLNGLLSNKIPLLRQLQWYLLVGANSFYAGNGDYYHEAFIGIDNIGWKIMRILRVDYVWSWDSNKGLNSGIRFGLSGKNFTVTKGNATHSEW